MRTFYFSSSVGYSTPFLGDGVAQFMDSEQVLGTAPIPGPHNILWIDDENGKNANHAIMWSRINNPKGIDLPADKSFYGITPGRNTIYEIIQI